MKDGFWINYVRKREKVYWKSLLLLPFIKSEKREEFLKVLKQEREAINRIKKIIDGNE